MTSAAVQRYLCPGCGEPFLLGDDTCPNCQYDLTKVSVPDREVQAEESDLEAPLTEVRMSPPHVLAPSDPVSRAVEILRDDPSGAVVIVEHGDLVGIFTERDVLKHVAGRPGVDEAPLGEVMTPDPVILRDTDTIAVALNKMAVGGFRHIPLVHDGHLVGVVTASELMAWFMQRYFD